MKREVIKWVWVDVLVAVIMLRMEISFAVLYANESGVLRKDNGEYYIEVK